MSDILSPPVALRSDGSVDSSKLGGELGHTALGPGGQARIVGDASTYVYDDRFGGYRVPRRPADKLVATEMLMGVRVVKDGVDVQTLTSQEDICRMLHRSPDPKTSPEPLPAAPTPPSGTAGTPTALLTPTSLLPKPETPPSDSSPQPTARSTRKRSSKAEDSELNFLRQQVLSLTNAVQALKPAPASATSSAPSTSSPAAPDVVVEFAGQWGTFVCEAVVADFRDGKTLVLLLDPRKPRFVPPQSDDLAVRVVKDGRTYDLRCRSYGFCTTFGLDGREYVLVLLALLDG